MREILTEGLEQLGLTPPEGAVKRLEIYARLLVEQNKVMNLTAITEPEAVARLHFLDSAAVLGYLRGDGEPLSVRLRLTRGEFARRAKRGHPGVAPPEEGSLAPRGDGGRADDIRPYGDEGPSEGGSASDSSGLRVIDVGTGAGFPGLVLKILEPSLSLTLLDSLGKRVKWLETVCRELGLEGVTCLHARAEEQALEPGFRDSFDAAVSRAVASLPLLTELCLPYVRPGGTFLAMKSMESGQEILSAQGAVKRLGGRLEEPVDYDVPGAGVTHRLVRVRKISNTPKGYPRKWAKIKKEPL